MKSLKQIATLTLALLWSCSTSSSKTNESLTPVQVLLETSMGKIKIELSEQTPLHRDNFVKIVNEQGYDSLLFHRVINEFMIQAGDPESKYAEANASLGSGDRDYKVPAEFHPDLYHLRGAVGAARDGNAERASSAMQFYIVQRGPRPDSLINKDEKRINGWMAEHFVKQDTSNAFLLDAIAVARETQDMGMYKWATDSIVTLADKANLPWYSIPEDQRQIYRTVGGTPHLDQNYTVFGQVIEGMDVVDAIAATETSDADRPVKDVRIITARIIKE